MADPGSRKRTQTKKQNKTQIPAHKTSLHWHWPPHLAQHIKPPKVFFLSLGCAEGGALQTKFSLYLFGVYAFLSLFCRSSVSLSIHLYVSTAVPSRATWDPNCLFLNADSESSEAPLSPSPSFAGNPATRSCLLACDPTRTAYYRIYVLSKWREILGRTCIQRNNIRNDSSSISIENTFSAGQDRAGTKRDVEACL